MKTVVPTLFVAAARSLARITLALSSSDRRKATAKGSSKLGVLAKTAVIVSLLFLRSENAATAAEITFLCVGALRPPMRELVPEFQAVSGHTVKISFASTSANSDRLRSGEPVDLAIVSPQQWESLNKEGKLDPSTREVIANVGVGVFVANGAARPDIGSVESLKRALVNAHSIAVPIEPGTLVTAFATRLFERLGISGDLKSKNAVGGGGSPFQAVARGEAQIGFAMIGDIIAESEVNFVGPVPDQIQRYVSFTAAVPANAKEPKAAKALVEFLISPRGMTILAAKTNGSTSPPRRASSDGTTKDITAILEQQKPDPSRAGKTRADADAEPPVSVRGAALASFLLRRAQARSAAGHGNEAIADLIRAIDIERAPGGDPFGTQTLLLERYRAAGDPQKGRQLVEKMVKETDQAHKGRFFGLYEWTITFSLMLGDLRKAEDALKKSIALSDSSRAWPNADLYRSQWAAIVESSKARISEAHGEFNRAEASYHKAQEMRRDAATKFASWPNPPLAPDVMRANNQRAIDMLLALEGRTKSSQGRLAEAEIAIRQALLGRLNAAGKFHPDTAQLITYLTRVVFDQVRYAEAEKLAGSAVEIYRSLGYPDDSSALVDAMLLHAQTLNVLQRTAEAAVIYEQVELATKNWDPGRGLSATGGLARVANLINIRNPNAAIEIARPVYDRLKARFGENHLETAMARGYYGVALARAGRDSEALQQFKAAIPMLIAIPRESDESATSMMQRDQRAKFIIENYISLLARNAQDKPGEVALETFRLADLIRGHAVQKALTASSTRVAARDPALGQLVRQEQDLLTQINAQLDLLNDALALPPEERDEKSVRDLQSSIEKLQGQRTAARRNIERRFPSYSDLVDPKPPTVDELRRALRPDEALVSFYFGGGNGLNSFVWVLPKAGPLAFARVDIGEKILESKVIELRNALEPDARTIGGIPPFDLNAAYALYALLLKPVEQAWKPAKHLIVVTNGALGLLPLSLLPTAPFELKPEHNSDLPFANYREVPWLTRTHAVTMIPSTAALRTLRQLPVAAAKREKFIGFGDPLFNAEQATESGRPEEGVQIVDAGTRGLPLRRRASPRTHGIDSAVLGLLPRLPDTAEELRSIAVALEADPSKVLHLGIEANEQLVKTTDLSKYRIIVFATHGLVPGDLDGLTQPALALTAPAVAHVPGDGLLTMEEILGLKLNADWVVLSACNTGSAAGAGAEAASGLGRAFFYAGTRAILVTNWSVHSASARELVADLFRRQSADPQISRAEALRQAMLAMIDSKGYSDAAGKMVFSYAHPLFWAPYSIIGDGGAN
jgi:molybdenum ABC transporter molybdate-binding protein